MSDPFERWLLDAGFESTLAFDPTLGMFRHPDHPGVEWIADWSNPAKVVVYRVNRHARIAVCRINGELFVLLG